MKYSSVSRILNCQHLFHSKCIAPIVSRNETCPICRNNIVGTQICERKIYKKNTEQDRERVVNAATRGEDWVKLALNLGVNYKTAHRWICSGSCTMKQKTNERPKKMLNDHLIKIVEWLEEDCGLTLLQLKQKLFRVFGVEVSTTTVGNHLEGMCYSVKKVHTQPTTMNSEENTEKRAVYVRKLNAFIQQGKQIVWIDETNFNLFCRLSRGRSKVGRRAIQALPAARGPNVHVIGAITASSILLMDRRRGSFTANSCSDWILQLVQKWQQLGNNLQDLVIVCDNAPCHSRIEAAVAQHSDGMSAVLRLGPYSPMLNPIEIIWSKFKTEVKTTLRIPIVNGAGLCEQRLQYLEKTVDDAKLKLSGGDCARAVQHTTTVHADALALQNIGVGE
ncbi:uncharacterized protein LOC118738120 [Rhagoletis pomonella]|uniref:uncharacterized protein LOC118738120 n=1 Tax=Rhagoletis pomonella TaxID=28610 RepID=UPI001786866B|nr:uncharacterized protein LOC118738120 [Rhagoletis pomonella]